MNALLRYPGAKWGMAPWIVRYLVKTYHYAEPYCGSAAVFFALPWRPEHAVLNDLSGDMMNFMTVVRDRGEELAERIYMTPYARAEYDQVQKSGGGMVATGDALEDARRWLIRCWMAQGGRVGNRSGWAHGGLSDNSMPARWRRLPRVIIEAAEMLRQAEIENRPALEVIRRLRDPDVLLYVDPPYVQKTRTGWRSKKDTYMHELTDADHGELLDVLDAHPGPVALAGYRCDLYDLRLAHWRRVDTQVSAEKGNTRTESMWLNPALSGRMTMGPLFDRQEDAA
jgi:DNA adenine methylase